MTDLLRTCDSCKNNVCSCRYNGSKNTPTCRHVRNPNNFHCCQELYGDVFNKIVSKLEPVYDKQFLRTNAFLIGLAIVEHFRVVEREFLVYPCKICSADAPSECLVCRLLVWEQYFYFCHKVKFPVQLFPLPERKRIDLRYPRHNSLVIDREVQRHINRDLIAFQIELEKERKHLESDSAEVVKFCRQLQI